MLRDLHLREASSVQQPEEFAGVEKAKHIVALWHVQRCRYANLGNGVTEDALNTLARRIIPTKMQCVHRAIRFVRTLRQQVLAGENVQARKRKRLRQTYDQEMGDVLRQPHDIRSWDVVAAPVLSSAATNQHRPGVRRDWRLRLQGHPARSRHPADAYRDADARRRREDWSPEQSPPQKMRDSCLPRHHDPGVRRPAVVPPRCSTVLLETQSSSPRRKTTEQ